MKDQCAVSRQDVPVLMRNAAAMVRCVPETVRSVKMALHAKALRQSLRKRSALLKALSALLKALSAVVGQYVMVLFHAVVVRIPHARVTVQHVLMVRFAEEATPHVVVRGHSALAVKANVLMEHAVLVLILYVRVPQANALAMGVVAVPVRHAMCCRQILHAEQMECVLVDSYVILQPINVLSLQSADREVNVPKGLRVIRITNATQSADREVRVPGVWYVIQKHRAALLHLIVLMENVLMA